MTNKQNAVNLSSLLIYIIFAVANGSPQCNLGLKLFSIEAGKAVCAPIAPFQCVDSCEWIDSEGNNGGCERSSHYAAFRGRRTYLSGIVLSEQSILLQCCASLATSVQLDNEKEAKCHWSEEIETVVDRPNVRFERVLGKTEYYRNLSVKRNGRSAIKLRAEVCRYTSERIFCERNKMTGDDFHKYSLLLMRLQRAKEFMQMRSNAMEQKDAKSSEDGPSPAQTSTLASLTNAGGEAKEREINQSELVNRKAKGRAIFKNRTNAIDGAILREAITTRINNNNSRDDQILLNGEIVDNTLKGPKLSAKIIERFGRRFWGEKEEIVSASPSPIGLVVSDNSSSLPPSSSTPFYTGHKPTGILMHLNTSPTTLPTPFFINAPSKERIIFNDPRRQLKKYNGSSRETGQTKTDEITAQNGGRESEHSMERAKNLKMNKSIEEHIPRKQNHEATMGPQHLAIRRIRYPQLMEQRAALALVRPSADSAMVWPRGHRRRLWPILTTNTTKELIPANIDQKWTDGKEQMGEQWQGTHRIRSGNVGKNWHNLDQMNYSFLDTENIGQQKQNHLTIRALSPSNQNANQHELRIKKLSRISNENGIRTKLDVKHLTTNEESGEKEFLSMSGSASGAGGSFASSEPLEEVGQTFPTLPTVRPKILPQILTHPLQKAPQFKFLSLLERSAEEAAVGQQIQSGTALGAISSSAVENRPKLGHRLMECCQQQAPGCRAICRRDVNKEEVKKVMASGQCPPVTMTGVIQCFPRFFNISLVGKCCAQQRTKIGESDANNSLLLQQTKAQTLPLQCLSLCAPNFHLTFAHLACVDHIEHILDCYRHLLEDNALNNDQFQQHLFPLSSSSPFS